MCELQERLVAPRLDRTLERRIQRPRGWRLCQHGDAMDMALKL